MSEILSREEFDAGVIESMDVLSMMRDGFSGSWDEYEHILSATIKALAEGLRQGVDEYWADADTDSDDFKGDAERELVNTLREKGWLP